MSETTGVSTGVSTTPNSYAEAAQERVQELRKWREAIPHFALPETVDATRRLGNVASVPSDFIELTNMAVANDTELLRVGGPTPAQVRDLMAFAEAYGPLADELEALATFLRYSTTAARNQAGHAALTTYALTQRLAKQPKKAHLKPYVADMRRALGRIRKLTPEQSAERLAQQAEKAAAKVAAKTKPARQAS